MDQKFKSQLRITLRALQKTKDKEQIIRLHQYRQRSSNLGLRITRMYWQPKELARAQKRKNFLFSKYCLERNLVAPSVKRSSINF